MRKTTKTSVSLPITSRTTYISPATNEGVLPLELTYSVLWQDQEGKVIITCITFVIMGSLYPKQYTIQASFKHNISGAKILTGMQRFDCSEF
jgi:hypothetical protein